MDEASEYKLESGVSHIFIEEQPVHAYKAFNQYTEQGAHGLCIARTHPQIVANKHGIVDVAMIWLSRVEEHRDRVDEHLYFTDKNGNKGYIETLNPERLLKVHTTLRAFFRQEGVNIAIIDGIEYLVLQNDFRSIMKFIQLINEDVAITNGILILPVNPNAMEQKELGHLERELQAYEHV